MYDRHLWFDCLKPLARRKRIKVKTIKLPRAKAEAVRADALGTHPSKFGKLIDAMWLSSYVGGRSSQVTAGDYESPHSPIYAC